MVTQFLGYCNSFKQVLYAHFSDLHTQSKTTYIIYYVVLDQTPVGVELTSKSEIIKLLDVHEVEAWQAISRSTAAVGHN